MIDRPTLERLLPDYLVRQRWFGFSPDEAITAEVAELEVWRDDWPGLVWALVDVADPRGGTARFQVFVGLRSVDGYEHFLDGKGRSLLGDVSTAAGEALAYDALVDGELALAVFHRIAPDVPATAVRPLAVEQSNTSVVVDESAMLKVFRRVRSGANPDVELPERLWAAGFHQTPEPLATWHHGGADLAVVRRFVPSGTDGFVLAQTSLRDLYDSRLAPELCGGDFAPEAQRLGQTLAALHLALAASLGSEAPDAASWHEVLFREVHRVDVPGVEPAQLDSVVGAVLDTVDGDLGRAIRVHGDLHLGQTLRADAGWLLLDFEGEPSRPIEERSRHTSPLRDVAGMLRSFHYASAGTLEERSEEVDDELRTLAAAWEARARGAFLDGYRSIAGIEALLPSSPASFAGLVRVFELIKAVYEVAYEQAHRPELVDVPLSAVHRLIAPPL